MIGFRLDRLAQEDLKIILSGGIVPAVAHEWVRGCGLFIARKTAVRNIVIGLPNRGTAPDRRVGRGGDGTEHPDFSKLHVVGVEVVHPKAGAEDPQLLCLDRGVKFKYLLAVRAGGVSGIGLPGNVQPGLFVDRVLKLKILWKSGSEPLAQSKSHLRDQGCPRNRDRGELPLFGILRAYCG